MKRTLIIILVVIVLILSLGIAGMLGYVWYRDNHVFVDGTAYPIKAESFDLREEDISFAHYEELQGKLPDAYILWNVPFQDSRYPSDSRSLTVSSLTEEDVAVLVKYFPYLASVDASKCQDYGVLELLKTQMPDLAVDYTVSLGGDMSFEPDVEDLILSVGDYDLTVMLENLAHLPDVKTIKLKMPELTLEQVDGLREAYPNITVTCTVEILGVEYDTQTTELDLSALTPDALEETLGKLSMLPGLTHVNLMKPDGTGNLSKENVKTLMEALPQVVFDYAFDFFGTSVSTADEEIVLKNVKIGDEGEAEIRLTLDLLTGCKRFVLDSCGLSNEVMAKIRDDYRDRIKVVWRINFGKGSTLTDAEIIRAVYDLGDKNCKNLIYCEDARFVDFGHNGDDGNYLHDCSYVAGMPKLEAIILSSAYISDLSAFANCKNLKMLEIAFCGMVTDISPLAGCEKLEMLNISFTGVTDISPLDNLPLTHLCALNYSNKRVSKEGQDRFQQLHPECWTQYVGEQPYGPGWRYTEDGKDYLPYYQMLRDIFRYEIFPRTPNHVGWYLSEELIEKYGL